jgi:hypothetical protein
MEHAMAAPDIKPELKELILAGLETHYISESCQDSIQTGNHYQSIRLGDLETTGFRSDRETILDRISFGDRTVLDLGSNLGELSRSARRRGARLVDGFEYDPFFVDMANAINTYNGTTRVSFFRRDITDPSVYEQNYDIVLALSVFVYISPIIDVISRVTKDLLVLETHRLDANLEGTYLEPVGRFFPHHRVIGESEWGLPHEPSDRRAIAVFAKSLDALELLDARLPTHSE